MRRTASEVIRNLEMRVARLEKQSIQFEQPHLQGWGTEPSVAYQSTVIDRMFKRTFEAQLEEYLKKKYGAKNINLRLIKVKAEVAPKDKVLATGKVFFMWGSKPYEFPIFVSQGGKHLRHHALGLNTMLYIHVGTPNEDLGRWLSVDPIVVDSNRKRIDTERDEYVNPVIEGVWNIGSGSFNSVQLIQRGTEKFYGRV